MPYREISTENTTTFIPDGLSGQISVLVFFPGIPVNGKIGKDYMPDLIKKGAPDWFEKYVIVIPNKHTTDTSKVFLETKHQMESKKLYLSNINVGIFSGSGNNSTSVQKTLSNYKLANLMIMDPYPGAKLGSNVINLKNNGSNVYFMYNPSNWDQTTGKLFEIAASQVGTANSSNVKFRHLDIPTEFLKKYKGQIEPTLVSPKKDDEVVETRTPSKRTPRKKIDGIFTFNVEKEDSFIIISSGTSSGTASSTTDLNNNIGELTIADESELFVFQDDFESLEELDPEFLETDFDGLDEQEYETQDEITNNINAQEQEQNLQDNDTGEVVDIKPVSSFDELLKLAGKLARVLGKNERVKYENLNSGYKKGVHGLCPQGTQAVLYALTGIKELGKIRGNADWFSFKNPPTGGGPASFSGTGHYNNKVKITQKNGKWTGTYLDNKQSHLWQIGDIVVMGYLGGKPYGHIQIWTGVKWMSDFKQNAIQQRNVDPNTVALWRLNEKGIAAIKAQANIGAKLA